MVVALALAGVNRLVNFVAADDESEVAGVVVTDAVVGGTVFEIDVLVDKSVA